MKSLLCFLAFSFFLGCLSSVFAVVPFNGKLSEGGVNFHGSARFDFQIIDGQSRVQWNHDDDENATLGVQVFNGRYSVNLGGQGMNPLPADLFLDKNKLFLRISVDLKDGEGLRLLSPDYRISSVFHSLTADLADYSRRAGISDGVKAGAITKKMLGQDVLSDLNRTVTHSNLSPQIKADLNRTITYTDLAPQIKADLNRTVTASQMAQNTITTAQLNEQILKYLKPEVTIVPQAPGLVFNNQTVTLLSRAEGKYLTYQWYKNGQPIAGATTDRYVIQDVNKTQHDGNYSLVVSNDFGSVTTPTATIDVNSTPTTHTVPSANNLEMIFCPPGTFMMGSPTTEVGRGGDETQHSVTLTNGFYLGKYEVTQAQYETVRTGNSEGLVTDPSQYKGSNRPVERVSWTDAQAFLAQLNAMEQTAGRLPAGWKYVLPTEAQWEYACRAGTTTAYSWGNDINSSRANYNWDGGATDGSDLKQTRDVGMYDPNPWGFFDMHGNVWEWVHDWYAYYPSGAITDPLGPALGSNRVYRGGAWSEHASQQRSAERKNWGPSRRTNSLGFRVAFQSMPADTASPELFLTGNTVMTHSQGIPFFDPGYEAHDARDGNITDQVVVTGSIDENSTGTYLLTYAVEDAAGNSATTVTRTVTVVGNHTVDLNATVALDMIWVQPGTFVMGSPTTETDRQADRETEHNVTLTQGFYLGKYEVTQAQYEAVMGFNPSEFNATSNGDRPVEDLNWTEALAFCEQLTIRERNAGRIPADWAYVLPTESQWEYACRAGTTTVYSWGDGIASTNANYGASGVGETGEVGQYGANPWGFFDMHGNVWEWTADRFAAAYPTENPTIDPTGPASSSTRVRSGWFLEPRRGVPSFG